MNVGTIARNSATVLLAHYGMRMHNRLSAYLNGELAVEINSAPARFSVTKL